MIDEPSGLRPEPPRPSRRDVVRVGLAAFMTLAVMAAEPVAAKDGSGNSGSGSGNSGSGSGNSGHGSGNSGPGGGGNSGPGGGDDHDNRGQEGSRRGPDGERIEYDGSRIRIIYPNGFREEIRNGIFEMRDPAGRRVIRRRATAEDFARLRALGM